jgi:NADPH-dependent 2,4-dienoyl-CoA reductase/sulfur reductase-like enzyme
LQAQINLIVIRRKACKGGNSIPLAICGFDVKFERNRFGLGNPDKVVSNPFEMWSGVHWMTPHVIIVGGGFGGLSAARGLRGASVRVTLIDKRNYHLFRPMLRKRTGRFTHPPRPP